MRFPLVCLFFFIPFTVFALSPEEYLCFRSPKEYDAIFNLVASGQNQKAIENIHRILEEKKSEKPQSLLLFLLGKQYCLAGKPKEAIFYLKQALTPDFILKDYLMYWLLKSYNQNAEPLEALNLLKEYPVKNLNRLVDHHIFWEEVKALIELQNWNFVNEKLNQRLKDKKEKSEKIYYYQILVAHLKGDHTLATTLIRKTLVENAGGPYERELFSIFLKSAQIAPDFLTREEWLKRADQLVTVGKPYLALPIYAKYLNSPEDELRLAEGFFKAKRYLEASELYLKLWHSPSVPKTITFKDQLLKSLARSNRFEEAIDWHTRFIKNDPDSPSSKTSRSKIAFLHFDSGNFIKAKEAYAELISKASGSEQQKYLYLHFWSAYLTRDFKVASDDLEKLEKTKMSPQWIDYWKARVLEKQGHQEMAKSFYQKLISEKKGYYSWLAAQRFSTQTLLPSTLIDAKIINDIPDERPSQDYPKYPLPAGNLACSVALSQVGLLSDAYQESLGSSDNDLSAQEKIELWMLASNFYRVKGVGQAALKKGLYNHFSWSLAHPIAYHPWIHASASSFQMNENLIWAIMSQESAFQPQITSQANAIGLMQIIPSTGEEIAKDLGLLQFHSEDLQIPTINIRFGSWYIKKLLDQFEGKLAYTFAAYNAGPEAVKRWESWSKNLEDDEFIELIPYEETNHYVKKVLSHYWVYEKLNQKLHDEQN